MGIRKFLVAMIMLIVAVAGTHPVFAAETVTVEATLTCLSGEVIVKTVACVSGEVVVAEGTCADGTITTSEAMCPAVDESSSVVYLGDYFRMGFRLHLGGVAGIPRSSDAGEGAGGEILGALVLSFPHLLADWWGIEFVGGAGITVFPEKDDVLSTNIFEVSFLFHLGETVDLSAGYRFTSLVDLDESLGHEHYARLGLSVDVGQFQIGLAGHLGMAVFTQKARHDQEVEGGGIVHYEDTRHITRLSGGGELTLTGWFW